MPIVDTNVLIDYMETNAKVLTLYHDHVEEMIVPRRVQEELKAMKAAMVSGLGLTVYTETVEQIAAASNHKNPNISLVDKVCLFVARDRQFPCATNDVALRTACTAMGVPVLWGFDLMVTLVADEQLEAATAIETAKQIQQLRGPVFCPQRVVDKFVDDVRKAG